jgi:alkyldihydroxyacetonephosphate synthase
MAPMKWWGWGLEELSFSHADKPGFGPYLKEHIGLDPDRIAQRPVAFESLDIPAPVLGDALRAALAAAVGADGISTDPMDRVVHARGKSLRDLMRQRRGDLGRVPDVVVRPADEAQVQAVLAAALEADAVLIPFGGGSSISGSLEAPAAEERTVISVDMARLDRVLSLDETSRLARVQAGVFGPHLEQQLGARGFSLGHFPDSFTHSTLGGWIATRSSGMQSDRYGDVADLTRAVRVVTPAGVLATRPVPSASTGPSLREMILGSEGRLGVITEATVHVHRVAASRIILGYLFPSWNEGLAAMQEISASEAAPSITRVSDGPETRFSFSTRKTPTPVDRVKSAALQQYLTRRRGFDTSSMALSFIGYEGRAARRLPAQAGRQGRVPPRRACASAPGPASSTTRRSSTRPYIRDWLLDRGALGDVSETARPWSALPGVYDAVNTAGHAAFAELGVRGYLMCHLSHSYHGGACLYFTFAFVPAPGREPLEQYDTVKGAVQQAFVDAGATLSHHHAVGTEHAPWLEQDVSPAASRCCAPCSTASTRGGISTREDRLRNRRAPGE